LNESFAVKGELGKIGSDSAMLKLVEGAALETEKGDRLAIERLQKSKRFGRFWDKPFIMSPPTGFLGAYIRPKRQ
jgi:hypothetical protein